MANKKPLLKSKFEKKLYSQLRRAKCSFAYEGASFPYTLVRRYYPDFTLTTKSGKVIHIEAKGHFDREARTKMRAVKLLHPELDIRFVFMADNKLDRKSKMRYSDWADKHGFKWTIGKIPKSWWNE